MTAEAQQIRAGSGSHNAAPASTGAVLAGGQSRRFGQDKALLRLGGETLLARALRILSQVTDEQVVIGPPWRAEQTGGARVVQDVAIGAGPLAGIAAALRAARHDTVLAVACDMPFLNPLLLAYLLSLAPGYDVVLPRLAGRGEQLHAVYSRACLAPIERQLGAGDFKVGRFFERVRVRDVSEDELRRFDSDLRSFRNVNTPEDWRDAQELLRAPGAEHR